MLIAPKKIVIIGPESTGKTILSEKLSTYYQCALVPEYAREYLDKNGTNYNMQDLEIIAMKQQALIDTAFNKEQKLLFCDTDLNVVKIWSEIKYNTCSLKILNALANTHCDLYLLCDIDIAWQADAQREHPQANQRTMLMHYYIDAISNSGVPFAIINGQGALRMQNAVSIIEKHR